MLRAGGPGICCISISGKSFYWKDPYRPWCSFSRLLVRTGDLFLPGVTWSELKANLLHSKPRSVMYLRFPNTFMTLFLPGVTWSELKANLLHPKPRSVMYGNVLPLPICLYDIVFPHVLRNFTCCFASCTYRLPS